MLCAPAFAQSIATDPPTQWQADAKANKQAAERAMPRQAAAGRLTARVLRLMLRPEIDLAAPLTDTLLLYRTRESVVSAAQTAAPW